MVGMREGTDVLRQTVACCCVCRMQWKDMIMVTAQQVIKFH